MIFELRPVSNECASHTHIWGKSIPGREGQVPGPKVAQSWCVQGPARSLSLWRSDGVVQEMDSERRNFPDGPATGQTWDFVVR